MYEQFYSIHGISLRLTTNSSSISVAAHKHLGYFQQELLKEPIMLECLFTGVSNRSEIPIAVPPTAQVLFSSVGKFADDHPLHPVLNCNIYLDRNRKIIDFHKQGLLLINDQGGRVEGYLVEPDAWTPDFQVWVFHFALTELLKRRQLYTIHAAALEKGGLGILIPGFSGLGKTTCCISLLRAGYSCLSDDFPLLRENALGLELLPFPMKIDVTDKTIEFFPELKDAKKYLSQGIYKHYFYIEDLYPDAQASACQPALIIFPKIVDWPVSHLELLPKSRALEELLPQALLVFDKDVARREFQVLSRLVAKADCYRLYFGKDILNLPQLIDQLLDRK